MIIESTQIVVALCTVLLSVVGFLLLRAVKTVDSSIAGLTKKVDALTSQDTLILVELAGVRARVTTLEILVSRFCQIPDSEAKP